MSLFGAACGGGGEANCCMWSVGFSCEGYVCEGTAAAVLDDDDDMGASFGRRWSVF